MAGVQKAFAAYRETLLEHRRLLLDRFKLADIAVKVVGVGSVGTRCGVMLLLASEEGPGKVSGPAGAHRRLLRVLRGPLTRSAGGDHRENRRADVVKELRERSP